MCPKRRHDPISRWPRERLRRLIVAHRGHGKSIARALGVSYGWATKRIRAAGFSLDARLSVYTEDEILAIVARAGSLSAAAAELRTRIVTLRAWFEDRGHEIPSPHRGSGRLLSGVDDDVLVNLLREQRGIHRAARALGVNRDTLRRELNRRGIESPPRSGPELDRLEPTIRALAAQGFGGCVIARALGRNVQTVKNYMSARGIRAEVSKRPGMRRQPDGRYRPSTAPQVPPRPQFANPSDAGWATLPLALTESLRQDPVKAPKGRR